MLARAAAIVRKKSVSRSLSPTPALERTASIAAPSPAIGSSQQVVLPGDDLAGRLEPVLRERPLQATDHRPLDPDVRVAPVLGSCASPVHSSAMPTPPVKATRPSARRSLAVGAGCRA